MLRAYNLREIDRVIVFVKIEKSTFPALVKEDCSYGKSEQ